MVKVHWEESIGISELCLSFYLRRNISDRFFNLAPHFIYIHLFQIDFKETKLTFLNFYDAMEAFVKQLKKEKVMSWTLLNDSYIQRKQLVHRYLQNNICYFRSPISPWTGPQLRSLFRAFFLSMVNIFIMQKISLNWAPVHAFLNIGLNFVICFVIKLWKKFGAKFGSKASKKMKNLFFGGYIEWETSVYFCPLSVLFKPHWPS